MHLQKTFGLWVGLLILLGLATAARGQDVRERLNFNRQWTFCLGDRPGAEAPAFNDAAWQRVGLPHSFSMPYFLADRFYVGYGWYRKHFQFRPQWAGKRLFLEFDGAFQDAEVFVNGRRIGRHLGGYTGFSLDITAAVKSGDNVVAVRVNNLWNPQQAPRGADHVFSGGIYRNVWLTATSPVHVTWYGTFVTTPGLTAEAGTVNVKTEVANQCARDRKCLLRTDILDRDGKIVASVSSARTVAAGATVTIDQTSPPIVQPKLWRPDRPVLYTAVSSIRSGGTLLDQFKTPFGFRWVKWTAERGMFLNGEHYYFHGANVHQDHAGWGDAVTDAGSRRDVKLIKDAGFDFIRGSHYPHSPAFSAACDELGMLYWSELCNWNGMQARSGWFDNGPIDPQNFAGYAASCKATLGEMIRIHRNHPSIIIWSMSNEAFFTDRSLIPQMKELIQQLVALSHELDPTRAAAVGGCQREGFDKLGDVAGYNGDGARLFIDPGIPSVVSEYGSVICDRPGKYDPGFGDLEKQPQFPWRSGQAIWCGFDHGTWLGRFGRMGIVDYARLPKRAWYWYRNEYKKIPPPEWPQSGTPARLQLTADKTTLQGTDATDDAQVIVTVLDAAGKPISNSPPVTLTVVSGPGEFPTGPSISFDETSDIEIRDGQAASELRSYFGGKTVIRATSPGLPAAELTLTSLGEPAYVPGVTPPVAARPYVRFVGAGSSLDKEERLGKNTPTSASSEAVGHSARLANDGDASTFWQARNAGAGAWWQVDLERLVVVKQTKITFPAQGNYRYKIEISSDAVQWKPLADQSRTTSSTSVRTDDAPTAQRVRFLRVTFIGTPPGGKAALAEVEVFGHATGP
jgi:hypothetical protein